MKTIKVDYTKRNTENLNIVRCSKCGKIGFKITENNITRVIHTEVIHTIRDMGYEISCIIEKQP